MLLSGGAVTAHVGGRNPPKEWSLIYAYEGIVIVPIHSSSCSSRCKVISRVEFRRERGIYPTISYLSLFETASQQGNGESDFIFFIILIT